MDLQNFDFNIYVIQLIFGAVDIPAKLVSILTITFVGRRFTQSFALILAGLAILANVLVPRGEGWGWWQLCPLHLQPIKHHLGGPKQAQLLNAIHGLSSFSFLQAICLKFWCLGSPLSITHHHPTPTPI